MTRSTGARRPTLRVERALQRDGHRVLAGMDEVGRGALAGPVTVGVVVIDESARTAPQGVRDSKLLQPHARERMVPRIERWALAHAVAHAGADEIDEIGIIAALRLAGMRALAACGVRPDLVILDGNHDWLTAPEDVGLLGLLHEDQVETPPVTTMVKADLRCSSVAGASVLAKVTRDALMVELGAEVTEYGWTENKGYAAPEHLDALRRHGPSVWHRRSWRLPGAMGDDGAVDVAATTGPGPAVSPTPAASPVLADLERVGER